MFPSATITFAILFEVSTKSSISGLIRYTPLCAAFMALKKFRCASSVITFAKFSSVNSTMMERLGSNDLYSEFISERISSKAKRNFSSDETTTVATLSRGMAFRRLPPSSFANCINSFVANSKRFISLLALPNPLMMSIPLWPPCNPLTLI